MENCRHMLAMIQKLQRLEVEKMGQILCVKKVPFRKSGHIYKFTLNGMSAFHCGFELYIMTHAVMCQLLPKHDKAV